jgi:hypothetical protein
MVIEKLTLIIGNSEEEDVTNTYSLSYALNIIFSKATNRIYFFVY